MPTNIFTQDETSVVDDNTTTTTTQISTDILVGEGKKYATTDELAKAYVNADSFIETLKEENRVLKEQTAKIAELDAAMARMSEAKTSSVADSDEVEPKGVDASEIAKLVDERLVARETAAVAKSNLAKAETKLKELFGEDAKAVFNKHAATPELRNILTTLAKTDPETFAQYMVTATGGKKESSSVVDGGNTVNTVNLSSVYSNRANDPETKEYYNELRKKDPSAYYSQAVQIQMQKAALKNNAKFYGTHT